MLAVWVVRDMGSWRVADGAQGNLVFMNNFDPKASSNSAGASVKALLLPDGKWWSASEQGYLELDPSKVGWLLGMYTVLWRAYNEHTYVRFTGYITSPFTVWLAHKLSNPLQTYTLPHVCYGIIVIVPYGRSPRFS